MYLPKMAALLLAGAALIACDNNSSTTNGSIASSPAPSGDMSGMVMSPSDMDQDKIFTVNGEDRTLTILSPKTYKVLGTLSIADLRRPHHISISADRRSFLVADPGMDLSLGHSATMNHGGGPSTGAIAVVDPASQMVSKIIKSSGPNHNAAYAPGNTNEIWTGNMNKNGQLEILTAQDGSTIKQVSVGQMAGEVSFSSDQKTAFIASEGDDMVAVVDIATKTKVSDIAVCAGPVVAWSGPENLMYTTCERGKALSILDAGQRTLLKTLPLGYSPGMVVVTKGGIILITDEDNGKLNFYRSQNNNLEKIGEVACQNRAHGIALSPDGLNAFVSNEDSNSVTVIDLKNMKSITTVLVGSKPNGIVYWQK